MRHALVGLAVAGLVGGGLAVPALAGPPGGSSSTTLPKITLSSASYTRTEDGGFAVITIKRTSTSKSQVSSARFFTADKTATAGADYGTVDQLVTFSSGQSSRTVNIPILQDTAFEGPETVNIFLDSPVSGAQLGSQKTAVLTITDDEHGSLSVDDPAPVTEGSPLTYTVTLSNPAVVPVAVDWAVTGGTSSGADRSGPQSGSVAFAPGAVTSQFTVGTVDDALDEVQETVAVTLSGQTAGVSMGDASGLGKIDDNDAAPTISIADASGAEGSPLSFTVSLSGVTASAITVPWSTAANGSAAAYNIGAPKNDCSNLGTDFLSAAAPDVVFPAGSSGSQTITVATCQDTDPETAETFSVILGAPTYGSVGDGSAVGAIGDDDNGGFESGLAGWSTYVDSGNPTPAATTDRAHSGTSSAVLGTPCLDLSSCSGEPSGASAVYRNVTVPSTGTTTVTSWVNDFGDLNGIDQLYAQVKDAGTYAVLGTMFDDGSANNGGTWTSHIYDLTPFAGQTVQLIWVAAQDGLGAPTGTYLDDVSISYTP